MKESMKDNACVTTGVFWWIDGRIYCKIETKSIEKAKNSLRVQLTNVIDSDLAHFEVWDELLAAKYPRADFATYPRGRVVYDLTLLCPVMYADTCIMQSGLRAAAKAFDLDKYEVRADEHYACDRCIKKRGWDF